MATVRTDTVQLVINPLSALTQVVFDNIEEDRYYYVCEREPGETPYDLYGRVTEKSGDRVQLKIIARREINDNGGEGAWVDIPVDDDDIYIAARDLVNSWEQSMSSRYYLPIEATP